MLVGCAGGVTVYPADLRRLTASWILSACVFTMPVWLEADQLGRGMFAESMPFGTPEFGGIQPEGNAAPFI